MDRRDFVRLGVAAGAIAGATAHAAAAPKSMAGEDLLDAGVREQGAAMAAGKTSSQQLVKRYLAASPPSTKPARRSTP